MLYKVCSPQDLGPRTCLLVYFVLLYLLFLQSTGCGGSVPVYLCISCHYIYVLFLQSMGRGGSGPVGLSAVSAVASAVSIELVHVTTQSQPMEDDLVKVMVRIPAAVYPQSVPVSKYIIRFVNIFIHRPPMTYSTNIQGAKPYLRSFTLENTILSVHLEGLLSKYD